MKKPLAGKRAFFAQGQRAAARGISRIPGEVRRLPEWAHTAWSAGYWSTLFPRLRPPPRRYSVFTIQDGKLQGKLLPK